jgi:hypothetical protein
MEVFEKPNMAFKYPTASINVELRKKIHVTMIIKRKYMCCSGAHHLFIAFVNHVLSIAMTIPCSIPQTKYVNPAPCQRPHSVNTVTMLNIAL